MNLAGKAALVTGGAQGLGKAFSEALLKRGAKVCLADVKVQQGEATAKALCSQYGKDAVFFVKCDVSNENDMKDAFMATKSTFKGLDIVVNNAGIADEKNWSKMVDINLKGVIVGTNLAIEHMAKDRGGKGGVIINVSSTAGLVPAYFCPNYTATKYGVVGLTKSWSENPYIKDTGLRFLVLCPAFTQTEIIDPQRNPHHSMYHEDSKNIIQMMGINKVETVVEGFMQLLDDESNNGAVMNITAHRGIRVQPKHPAREAKL